MSQQEISPTAYMEAVFEKNTGFFAEKGRWPRYFILTFGCQQNVADSEKLSGMAAAMGYQQADSATDADLILVNTCAIREHAEDRALSSIGQYKKEKEKNPSLILGVCGCMVSQNYRQEQIKRSYPYVNFVLDTASLHELPQRVSEAMEGGKRHFGLQTEDKIAEGLPICRGNDYRASVSIMYGCNNFCSYCIVPYVRGRERSREPEAVVHEVREAVQAGCRDILLLGQNVNSYRRGASDGYEFPDLLAELDRIEGDYVLHFMTSHPKDATKRLVDVMAAGRHIAHAFHLPLQSGSDRILTRMNRHYDRATYLDILDYMRKKIPDVAVTSDIIVGFPGESDADFEDTLSMIRRARFDMIYSFIFSPRKGTPAAEMADPVPRAVQNERFDRLLAAQEPICTEINRALVGKTVRVLSEGSSRTDPGVYTGRTDQNKIVFFGKEVGKGQFVNVKIDRGEAFALYGTVTE